MELEEMQEIRARLGVIADLQFVPKWDSPNFSGIRTRRYHNSIRILKTAVQQFNQVQVDQTDLFNKSDRTMSTRYKEHRPMGCMCDNSPCVSKKCLRRADILQDCIDRDLVKLGIKYKNSGKVAIPKRDMDMVLQLGDVIDGQCNTVQNVVYGAEHDVKTCEYCIKQNNTNGNVQHIALSDIQQVPQTHMSQLQPQPCPVLVEEQYQNLKRFYKSCELHTEEPIPLNYGVPTALMTVFGEIVKCKTLEWHHLVGNHELYNVCNTEQANRGAKRSILYHMFGKGRQYGDLFPFPTLSDNVNILNNTPTDDNIEDSKEAYIHKYVKCIYSSPQRKYYLIVLDAYAIAYMGYATTSTEHMCAHTLQTENNPNIAERTGRDWSVNLPLEKMRFVPFNGAIGEKQLNWLDETLGALDETARVIVTCHIPANPEATGFSTTLFDRDELLALFAKHQGKVALTLAGHDHDGGYCYDRSSKTHHFTVPAPIECTNGHEAFCVMDLYDDGIQVYGAGRINDMYLQV